MQLYLPEGLTFASIDAGSAGLSASRDLGRGAFVLTDDPTVFTRISLTYFGADDVIAINRGGQVAGIEDLNFGAQDGGIRITYSNGGNAGDILIAGFTPEHVVHDYATAVLAIGHNFLTIG